MGGAGSRALTASLAASTGFLAFGYPGAPLRRAAVSARHAKLIRLPSTGGVAALGDSLTLGRSWPKAGLLSRDSWLSYAVAAGIPYCFNAAVGGYTTGMVANTLASVLVHRPDVVVVCTGSNDLVWGISPDQTIEYVARLLARIASSARPVLCTLPPMTGKRACAPTTVPVIDRALVRDFNERVAELAARGDVPLVDFYAPLDDGTGSYRVGFASDGVHPTAEGAAAMGAAAVPVLRRALAQRA
ncbi:MAG: SGNH/GDSL hydrolase family protein [Actinomycetota bacterium]|nr:SGNH/GDSL hydrolase family protein [Actinomycetota bacterium]